MDYFNHYIKLVDSRQSRGLNRETGYEIHHIVPRCLGGENEQYNLVKLTYKEHFIAHKLLYKAFPEDKKLTHAFTAMTMNKENISSNQVQKLKSLHSLRMKENNPMHNINSLEKMRKTRKEKFASGELVPRIVSKKERDIQSRRMKENNPMTLEPWKNHTASPVRIHYVDGTFKDFKYMKEVSIVTGVPYNTLKYISRNNVGSPKWSILKIEKLKRSTK